MLDGTKEKGRKGKVVNCVGSRAGGARDEEEAIQRRAEDWLKGARSRSKRMPLSGRPRGETGEGSGGAERVGE